MSIYLGIDFSGDQTKWGPKVSNSNVWIAKVDANSTKLNLIDLKQVQQLNCPGRPFEKLSMLLKNGDFEAAGIDAPFSVPKKFMQKGGHRKLLEIVSKVELNGRDFPKGIDFFQTVTRQSAKLEPLKPLRQTEQNWKSKGLNVRSTLWTGSRGGAPMTSACLALLKIANRPIWPLSQASCNGLLVEAFPAAQLKVWGLPYERYNNCNQRKNREEIVEGISSRINLGRYKKVATDCADALDAVLCSFGAIAVKNKVLEEEPDKFFKDEGWIAVHGLPSF